MCAPEIKAKSCVDEDHDEDQSGVSCWRRGWSLAYFESAYYHIVNANLGLIHAVLSYGSDYPPAIRRLMGLGLNI